MIDSLSLKDSTTPNARRSARFAIGVSILLEIRKRYTGRKRGTGFTGTLDNGVAGRSRTIHWVRYTSRVSCRYERRSQARDGAHSLSRLDHQRKSNMAINVTELLLTIKNRSSFYSRRRCRLSAMSFVS